MAKGPGFRGLLSFLSAQVDRQTDDQAADRFLLDDLPEEFGIFIPAAAAVGGQRRRDNPVRVADRQADAHGAVIDSQEASACRSHRYFSRPFLRNKSTNCLTALSLRR